MEITIELCLVLYEKVNLEAVIENGKVTKWLLVEA